MNGSNPGAAGVGLIGLLTTNIALLFGTVLIAVVFDVTAVEAVTGTLDGSAHAIIRAWVVAVALFGVIDVLVIVMFIGAATDADGGF